MLAFPLHLSLMTDRSFPFPPLGLVHIANRDRPAPSDRRDRAAVAQRVGHAARAPPPRNPVHAPHRGPGRARSSCGRSARRYLQARRLRADGRRPRATPVDEELPVTATWRLPGDLGRRYASVSGDLNPIHVHPLSARLFGFPTAIAHGMWTKARCLAALEPRAAGSLHGRGRVPQADPAAGDGAVRRSARTRVGSASRPWRRQGDAAPRRDAQLRLSGAGRSVVVGLGELVEHPAHRAEDVGRGHRARLR